MKKIKQFLKDESGVMVATQALFIYPLAIFIFFTVIYMMLFAAQAVMVQNYAQKIAVLAAREIAYPRYIDLAGGSETAVKIFGTSAVDWQYTSSVTVKSSAKDVTPHAYRYITGTIGDCIDSNQMAKLQSIASNMVNDKTIIKGTNVTINIDAKSYFVTQTVDVTISENFTMLNFVKAMGFNGSNISATATAVANDPDEFVRNVDLVFDFSKNLADKLGINTDKFSEAIGKVKDFLNKFNVK